MGNNCLYGQRLATSRHGAPSVVVVSTLLEDSHLMPVEGCSNRLYGQNGQEHWLKRTNKCKS